MLKLFYIISKYWTYLNFESFGVVFIFSLVVVSARPT